MCPWQLPSRVNLPGLLLPQVPWDEGARLLDACTKFVDPRLAEQALRRGYRLTVCDIEPETPDVVKVDLGKPLPWRDGWFRGVICADTLEHIELRSEVVAEFWRVTEPGGFLMLHLPVPRRGREFSAETIRDEPGNPHRHVWVPGCDFAGRAEAAGYRLIGEVSGYDDALFHLRKLWVFERVAGRPSQAPIAPGDPYAGMTRARMIRAALDALPYHCDALEVGRLRDPKETTGHSTLHIAAHRMVMRLASIDITAETEAACRAVLPPDALKKVDFLNGDAAEVLGQLAADGNSFGFIYLDGPNDADACMAIFEKAVALAAPSATLILDDTDNPDVAKKGLKVLPYIQARPDKFRVVKTVKRDKTCHGQTVILVNPTERA